MGDKSAILSRFRRCPIGLRRSEKHSDLSVHDPFSLRKISHEYTNKKIRKFFAILAASREKKQFSRKVAKNAKETKEYLEVSLGNLNERFVVDERFR